MNISRIVKAAFVAAAACVCAAPSSPIESNNVDKNLLLLREMRTREPERYARLVANYRTFAQFPPARQEQLRTLDRQLNEADPQTKARLLNVLESYAAWLTRLPPVDQQRIHDQKTGADKLKVIREIKQAQWLALQPKARRDEYDAATTAKRKQELITHWQEDEAKRARDWSTARRFRQEFRPEGPMSQFLRDEFRNEVDEYIRLKLMPMLSQNERNRLTADFERTKTNPLTYPMVLRRVAELADEHPLLGLEPKYADFDSLPMEYQSMLRQLPETKFETVNSLSGRWPDFPLAVTKIARDNKVSMKVQLGPSTLQEFSPEIEAFVANKFSPEQRKRLKSAEGLWPEYPKLLHEAAKTSRAAVPGLSPPGEFQMWERFRTQRKFGPGDRP